MRDVRFGVIGCGLMGKEFACAAARWMQVKDDCSRPVIVAACDVNLAATEWFRDQVSTVKYVYSDYRELLKNEEIEAVYCALPHSLHKQVYVDIIESGKHFMGEKPFGIDMEANKAIVEAARRHPDSVIRCASEFPYYPGCQILIDWIRDNRFGRILEVHAGFNHSSDMNPDKPINWKRMVSVNGEYGCMGDLGIHAEHIPFRMGWTPLNVFAKLGNYVTERPDGKGKLVPCDTWDNATLICDAKDAGGNIFPLTLEMKRMKPAATNDWYLEVHGMNCSARFSTDDPNAFHYTVAEGNTQAWMRVCVGTKPLFETITSDIFEFGFTDAILQMWVAFMKEIDGEPVRFGCFTPEETVISHQLHTAALLSEKTRTLVELS